MSNILQTIGTIVGLVTGGPKGAALGSGLGTLLSGGSFKDALTSGVGSLFATNHRCRWLLKCLILVVIVLLVAEVVKL